MIDLWIAQINSLSAAQSLTLILLSLALAALGFIYNSQSKMEDKDNVQS